MLDAVAILRRTSIFAATPDTALLRIAVALEHVHPRAGELIFDSGDPGDCLYIIASGRVQVHDGDLVLNYLEDGDVFGEMAVLDPQPRSAAVTAVTDTHLLRLSRQPVHELINTQPGVGHAIITVLCRHLRARVRDLSQDFVYLQQFARVTAAAQAVEAGAYHPDLVRDVARRPDALGDLARVFDRMATEIVAREQQLRQQVRSLQIQIDRAQQAQQVKAITETPYFKELQQHAASLRGELDGEA